MPKMAITVNQRIAVSLRFKTEVKKERQEIGG
jgi:hypothetical protein